MAQKSLFGTTYSLESVANINFDNFYIEGVDATTGNVSAISYKAKKITSCKLTNSTLKTAYIVASFVYKVDKEIANCSSDATLMNGVGSIRTAGIVSGIAKDTIIENCSFHGKIKGHRCSAGIISDIPNRGLIINCENYGYITGEQHTSGIAGTNTASGTRIINCKNYGEIFYLNYKQYEAAGILAYTSAGIDFVGCESYGEVYYSDSYARGLILAECAPSSGEEPITINIINCKTKAMNNCPIITYPKTGNGGQRVVNYNIKNCEFSYENKNQTQSILLFTYKSSGKIYFEGNVFINKSDKNTFKIIRGGLSGAETIFKDCMVYVQNDKFDLTTSALTNKEKIYGGIVINVQNTPFAYYGSDFDGFYIDFKTGKIGLKALSGKGFYQGKVSEGLVQSKGYTKKTI